MQLDTLIEKHFRLTLPQKQALKKLKLATLRDILFHFPSRYEATSSTQKIADVSVGDKVMLYGTLKNLKTSKAYHKKIPMAQGVLEDDTGKIKVVWFHQPYLAKMLSGDTLVKAEGTVTERKGKVYLANPTTTRADSIPPQDALFSPTQNFASGNMLPIYPESRGISSLWFYYCLQKLFASDILDSLDDPLPQEIRTQYTLPSLKTALIWIHTPQKHSDALAARKRFSFEEIFFIQLKKQQERFFSLQEPSWNIDPAKKDMEAFIGRFPFSPTKAQTKAIADILKDFKTPSAMSRLLEGDVGSGKTFVAAATAYAAVTAKPEDQDFGNLQVAYMAPTEILAKQHFESFMQFFSHLPIQIGLITSSGCKKFPSKVNPAGATDISRTQLLKWVKNGEIPILIGTHALIQKSVAFKHLAYVVIDEQHRFGVNQRAHLVKKNERVPHLLSMTATPIPRTLALTLYGDLDLTLLDEMPPGRKQIITKIISPEERKKSYEHIQKQLKEGRQMYVICPRINEPDEKKAGALRVTSVTAEAARLKKDIFPEHQIDILHGKLKPTEKEDVMQKFAQGETDILVATSVVEVGMNVPNSTVIIIEGAERFGLAQLHQLRGRVLRSTHQAYCYIFSDTKSTHTFNRLKALQTSKNGFELAEQDLKFRGAGDLWGRQQWGISDIGMEALQNMRLVEAARKEAQALIEKDSSLSKHQELQKILQQKERVHFE